MADWPKVFHAGRPVECTGLIAQAGAIRLRVVADAVWVAVQAWRWRCPVACVLAMATAAGFCATALATRVNRLKQVRKRVNKHHVFMGTRARVELRIELLPGVECAFQLMLLHSFHVGL